MTMTMALEYERWCTRLCNGLYYVCQHTGETVCRFFRKDLERRLDNGVEVALYYGDVDYVHSWLGGQAMRTDEIALLSLLEPPSVKTPVSFAVE